MGRTLSGILTGPVRPRWLLAGRFARSVFVEGDPQQGWIASGNVWPGREPESAYPAGRIRPASANCPPWLRWPDRTSVRSFLGGGAWR
jgi:hypothetical protein